MLPLVRIGLIDLPKSWRGSIGSITLVKILFWKLLRVAHQIMQGFQQLQNLNFEFSQTNQDEFLILIRRNNLVVQKIYENLEISFELSCGEVLTQYLFMFLCFRALSLHNKVIKSNKKIQSLQEAQIILQKFKDYKWLTTCEETGAILLSTRFIFEMEPFLRYLSYIT